MATIRKIGMVSSEVGELGSRRLGVGSQPGTQTSRGELLGIRLPVERHRELASTTGQRLAVVCQLRIIE